jgi:hypothetical protein
MLGALPIGGVVGAAVAGITNGVVYGTGGGFWGTVFGAVSGTVAFGLAFTFIGNDPAARSIGHGITASALAITALGFGWWIVMWGIAPWTPEGLWTWSSAAAASVAAVLLANSARSKRPPQDGRGSASKEVNAVDASASHTPLPPRGADTGMRDFAFGATVRGARSPVTART